MNIPKFRGWIKAKKEMHDVLLIDWLNGLVDLAYSNIELDFNEVELMQSTGLKDKNGVEIFEGDILKTRRRGFAVVKTKDGNSTVKYKSRLNSTTTATLLHFMDMCKVEVIGNIYENSELLEV